MNFIELKEQEYVKFYNAYHEKNFWQSTKMCRFKERQGWKIYYVGLKDKENIVAASALVAKKVFFRYSLFMALRGFMINYDDMELVSTFIKGLKKFLHCHNCMYMKIDPYVSYQLHNKDGSVNLDAANRDDLISLFEKYGFHHLNFSIGSDNNHEPRWISVLDLKDKTEDDILKGMDSHTRQNIKNTIKTGIKIRELEKNEFSILHKIVSDTGERRHFLNPDLNYYERFYDSFDSDMKALYVYLDTEDYYKRFANEKEKLEKEMNHIEGLIQEADTPKNAKRKEMCLKKIEAAKQRMNEALTLQKEYGDKIPLGAAMFVITPYEIVYLFSGSYKNFNRFKGAYAIQWEMIEYALKHHIDRYNFYGISGIFDESDEEYGVFLFKKGFGANVIELIGEFEYIDRKVLYSFYSMAKNMKQKILKILRKSN